MSKSIQSLYEAGLFSTLAYVDWTAISANRENVALYLLKLQDTAAGTPGSIGPNPAADKALTEAGATEFANKYVFADYWADAQTGFAATVFKDKNTNRYIVAFRGVEPGQTNDWRAAIQAVVARTDALLASPQEASLKT